MQDLTAGNVALTIFPLLQKGIEYDDRLENLIAWITNLPMVNIV